MDFLKNFSFLWDSFVAFLQGVDVNGDGIINPGVKLADGTLSPDITGWKMLVMILVGCLLIYLALAKDFEPSLLMPMGLGAILVNLPFSGAVGQAADGSLIIAFVNDRGFYPAGITYSELASLMYEYDAVNAAAFRAEGGFYADGVGQLGSNSASFFSFIVKGGVK